MKKNILLVFFVIISVLSFTACKTNLKELNEVTITGLTLDTKNGTGPQMYDGKMLPLNPDGKLKTYTFAFNFNYDSLSFNGNPCLVIGPSTFPYKLRLNGNLLYTYGSEGSLEITRAYPSVALQLPSNMLLEVNVIEVDAEISVERVALMDMAVVNIKAGAAYVFWRNFFMFQLQAGGLSIGILLFLYFMFVFVLGRGKNLRFLWFALFCGCFSLACVNVVFNHQAISDTLITKIGRSGFIFCSVFLSLYVIETTGVLLKRKWLKYVEFILLSLGVVWVCIQSDFIKTNDAFDLALQLVITPNLLLCVALIIIASIKQGFRNYAILSVGFVGIIITSLYDMITEGMYFTPYAWALVYGYAWFVICVFLELAVKQERISRTALKQSEDLGRKNAILQSVFTELQKGSNTLTASTEELAVSTREISATGKQQAVAVKEIVSTMEDAGSLLKNISTKSSMVNQESKATAEKADAGALDVKNALAKLEAVINRSAESISLITDFNEHLGSITEVIKLIESIAVKIRIIAFNASLEAVAAGEAGKNFCIVADEVKYLSDSTMASAKNIKEKVTKLIAMSNNVVQVSQQGYKELEQSWDIAAGMGTSFSGIQEASEASALATADIDTSIKEETQAFEQILQTLKEISGGVNNFVDSATHTSETTNTLNGIAENLHKIIKQYSGEFDEEDVNNKVDGVRK